MNHLLDPADIAAYRANGHILLRQILDPAMLEALETELTTLVRSLDGRQFAAQILRDYGQSLQQLLPTRTETATRAASSSDTYARAFTQRLNLWRYSEAVAQFVHDRRLAQLATELMEVSGVRLYHDQALYKEAGGGHTPWHVDQYYWPLATEATITAWIPLQDVSIDMGPVAFASGSHRLAVRETALQLAISDESEAAIADLVAGLPLVAPPCRLGDVSFHSGWTCHRAGPNLTDRTRAAFTIIYMDKDMEMAAPRHDNHAADAALWLPGVQPGELAASPLNPLLYDRVPG